MSSWTDQIPKFNPYIQQLPVDAMVKVGMQKQQQYDEGVQKIQTSIDNVAGLDVGRDVEKSYLTSKLNELGSKLKTVAAGDFSNFQLVNSVSGMTGQLIKDPIINTAVQSRSNDKAQMAQLEKDRSEGKLTPQAEYIYNLKRQAFYNNDKLTSEDGKPVSFSGKYIQSWDINKALTDAIKAVGDSKYSSTNVFKTDPNTGLQMVDKTTGMPVYSEFAIKEIKEGKFSENVSAAIDSVLSRPEAKQELSMQGIYNYRNYDDINDFIEQYKKEQIKGISLYQDKKLDLLSKSALEKNPDRKKQYENAINDIDSKILTLQKEDPRVTEAQQFSSLDAYKAALQTRRVTNQYMQMGVTEKISKDYVESIPYKVGQEKVKADRDWYMAQDASKRGWASVKISRDSLNLEKEKWKADPKNPNATTATGGMYGDFTASTVSPQELLGKFVTDADDASRTLDAQKKEFLVEYLITINNANGKSLSKEQAMHDINVWSKNDKNFIDTKYNHWKNQVEKNAGNAKFTNLASMLPRMNSVETSVKQYAKEIDAMNNSPEVKAAGDIKKYDVQNLTKNLKPWTINYRGIKNITLSPTDIVNFQILQTLNTSGGRSEEAKVLERQLRSKFSDPDEFQNIYKNVDQGPTAGRWETGAQEIYKQRDIMANSKKMLENQTARNIYEAKQNYLKRVGMGDAQLNMSMYPKDAETKVKESINDRTKVILASYKEAGMDVSKFENAFTEKATANIQYNIDRETGKIKMQVYDGSNKLSEIEITKANLDYMQAKDIRLPERVSSVQKSINSSSNNTTNFSNLNVTDPRAYQSAYKNSSYFINNANRTDVLGADIIKNYNGEYNIYIYHRNANGDVNPIPLKRDRNSINAQAFSNVDAANELLNSKYFFNTLDEVIKNAK